MKTVFRVLLNLAGLALLLQISALQHTASAQKSPPGLKIGTYDSRLVVYAYHSSDLFREKMKKLSEENDKLIKSGDTLKMKEGAMNMITFSFLLEKSVFSCAPVPDFVLGPIREQFGKVAEKAGVDLIVSKWDIAFANPAIETVDVTGQIIDLLKPTGLNEEFLKEISDQKPYSADEYGLGESIQTWDQFKVKYHLK